MRDWTLIGTIMDGTFTVYSHDYSFRVMLMDTESGTPIVNTDPDFTDWQLEDTEAGALVAVDLDGNEWPVAAGGEQ